MTSTFKQHETKYQDKVMSPNWVSALLNNYFHRSWITLKTSKAAKPKKIKMLKVKKPSLLIKKTTISSLTRPPS